MSGFNRASHNPNSIAVSLSSFRISAVDRTCIGMPVVAKSSARRASSLDEVDGALRSKELEIKIMNRMIMSTKTARCQADWWCRCLIVLAVLTTTAASPLFAQSESTNSGAVALLIRNPNTSGSQPPFALTDQYGRIQRYIEPSPGIDLTPHIGTKVRVKSDTGKILLSSQLELGSTSAQLKPLKTSQRQSSTGTSQAQRSQPSEWKHSGRLLTPIETVQFDEDVPAVNEDPAAPIMLDEILPDPNVEVDSLERSIETNREELSTDDYEPNNTNLESVEPLVIEELPLQGSVRHDPVIDGDCESCRNKPNKSYRSRGRYCENCNRGQCKRCNDLSCCPASEPGIYGRAEYTLWWFDEMYTPPLVTSGTVASEAVLGRDGTQVLFGGDLLDDPRSGLRLTLGAWLDDQRDFAIEGDYFITETESIGFQTSDLTGAPVIGRPFYNLSPTDTDGVTILPPAEDAELVSFPNLVAGTVGVQARSEFDSFGLRLRTGLCCKELGCGTPCGRRGCNSCGPNYGGNATAIYRIDFIGGYRYANLDESLAISENLTSLQSANPGSFLINDRFDTDNEFHGVDLGVVSEWENKRWAVELTSRIAIGSTRQRVTINGSTTTSNNGASFTSSGGLLALDSNIGTYKRSRFGVLPELSARLAYKVRPDLRLSVGYSLMYWANVVRPGEQIDLSIDPRFIPPATATPVASSHPQFNFHETGFWAHGLNFGLDYRY